MKTPTASPSRMLVRVVLPQAAKCSPRFPPRAKLALHEAVLNEILEERVVQQPGTAGAARVKRKMSNYPLRPRAPQPTTRIDFTTAIQIVK